MNDQLNKRQCLYAYEKPDKAPTKDKFMTKEKVVNVRTKGIISTTVAFK